MVDKLLQQEWLIIQFYMVRGIGREEGWRGDQDHFVGYLGGAGGEAFTYYLEQIRRRALLLDIETLRYL